MTARKQPASLAVRPRIKWTEAAVRGLGVRTDLRTAGSIFGLSATQSYEAAKAGRFPVPVLRVGVRYVVPVAPILAVLGLDDGGGPNRSDGPDQERGGEDARPGTSGRGGGGADAA